MKKIYLFLQVAFISLSILFSTASCTENEMDNINKNNSTPPVSSVDARFQLSDAIMSMAFVTYAGSYAWHIASYTEQVFGTGGNQMMFAELRDPIITAAPTTFNNEWNNTYRNLLSINIIIQKCESGVNRGQIDIMGMARVLKVLGFQALTELHGDIPYSEALNENIRAPKLDKQQDIYSSLLNEINLAIENLTEAVDKNMKNGGKQDILFSGDSKKWLAFAYAVKARLLLNESAKEQNAIDKALSSAQKAVELGFDGADLSIFNGVEADNPWAAFFRSRHYSGACNTVVELMEQRLDPRLKIYAYDLFSTGVLSAPAGDATLSATIDNVGGPAWLKNESASVHLLSKASLYFIIAECKVRKGLVADEDLDQAIRASMKDYADNAGIEISFSEIESYLSNISKCDLKEIMIQKYISQARDEQIETYNDLRRCRALNEQFIILRNPNNTNNGQNRWPLSMPYGNSDVVSNPNITEVFGTGNNAGYYIFDRSLWLFSN